MKDHPPGAALALAIAIIALPLAMMPLLGSPAALLALIIASWSRRRVRAQPEAYRESAMPSAATVCALVALGASLIAFLAWTMLLALVHGGPSANAEPLRF